MDDVHLRRRHDGALELRVNGVFVMDDLETSSERLLARHVVDLGARDVLVGGLGLGFTLRELLAHDVRRVVVAELHAEIVRWMGDGTVPGADLLDDDRTEVVVADVRDVVLAQAPASLDAICLDVDNGPDFLVHDENAAVYRDDFVRACAERLRPDGHLAIWSMADSADVRQVLAATFETVAVEAVPVDLQGRAEHYWVLTGSTPRTGDKVPDMTDTTSEWRIEHDTMGEVKVPADALWRAQTQRAVENFPISGTPIESAQIRALAQIKAACAKANAELGILDADIADAIVAAAEEVASGAHDAQFPIDVFQTGSGTSSNMNTNEVIATLATKALGKDVHPNDHVNASQSSNDVFPTSIHVAATASATHQLIPALDHLATSLEAKSAELANVVKAGRTHLMDATPVTLGQEFGGYAMQIRRGIERVEASLPRTAEVPLGGTAVGTGINTPKGFPQRVIELLAEGTGLPITEAVDHFEAQSARDGLVEMSGQLRTIAVSLTKICNDLRWMGSGPRAGLGEINLPDLQPGSSIMPGKVNPVLPEATLMVAAQVIGNDATIATAGSSGVFELNVMLPVIGRNILESMRLLANASTVLADRCIDGITANVERCLELAESSPSVVTPLNRHIGYENAAAIAKKSVKERKTIRQVVIEEGYVERGEISEADLDSALDVMSMTHP